MTIVKDRLLARRRIDPDTGCWEFTGARLAAGYGIANDGEKTVTAHRLAYRIWKGGIPDGGFVCHRCDNPPCINPEHLFLGDINVNVRDSVEKNRHARGETHGQHRLAWQHVA